MIAPDKATPIERYARLAEAGRRAGPAWLNELAGAANEVFRAQGFPDRRNEDWRYTTLSKLLEQAWVPAVPNTAVQFSDLDDLLIAGLQTWRIVLVNGRFEPRLSTLSDLPDGVWVGGLAKALETHGDRLRLHVGPARAAPAAAFANLNLAGAADGAAILLDAGVKLARPIELIHLTVGADDPQLVQPRHFVLLETGAAATLVERYVSLGESVYLDNVAVDLVLQDRAELDHHYIQQESASAYHVRTQYLSQAAGSRYRALGGTLGAGWSRADWHVDFAGSGAECVLRGLYVVGDGQLADNHLHVHHRVPGCTSREDFRGVLNGRGRGVFDGRIVVHQDAQKTDARLSNNNLLLSREAEVDTKPQLEIYADDVACSHGTTVGQIEPEQLFYLRSRGIAEGRARRMICLGFAQSVLADVADRALADYLTGVVGERLDLEVAG